MSILLLLSVALAVLLYGAGLSLRQARRYRRWLDAAADPLLLVTATGRLRFVNARACQLFGLPLSALLLPEADGYGPLWDRLLFAGGHQVAGSLGLRQIRYRDGRREKMVVDAAAQLARLQRGASLQYRHGGHSFAVSASFGVVCFPDGGDSTSQLFAHADQAMYRAKAQGNGSVWHYRHDGLQPLPLPQAVLAAPQDGR